MMATGGWAARSMGSASEPSIATSSSCTILTTIWPGVTDLTTFWPTALAFTLSVKSRTTSSATSASSSARRTSRMASPRRCRSATRAGSACRGRPRGDLTDFETSRSFRRAGDAASSGNDAIAPASAPRWRTLTPLPPDFPAQRGQIMCRAAARVHGPSGWRAQSRNGGLSIAGRGGAGTGLFCGGTTPQHPPLRAVRQQPDRAVGAGADVADALAQVAEQALLADDLARRRARGGAAPGPASAPTNRLPFHCGNRSPV